MNSLILIKDVWLYHVFDELGYEFLYNDVFDNVKSAADTTSSKIKIIGVAIMTLCFIIAGVMLMLGDGSSRIAKRWIVSIVAGGFIIFLATQLASTVKTIAS